MNNKELYRKTFDNYYDTAIKEINLLSMKKVKTRANRYRKISFALASFFVLVFSITIVVEAAGWFHISDVFMDLFQDQVSEGLIKSGKVQELNIVNENEDFIMKLSAITGDMETTVALFELTPKVELGNIDGIELIEETSSHNIIGTPKGLDFHTKKMKSVYDQDKNVYYIRHIIINSLDDIAIRVLGVRLYTGNSYTEVNLNMDFNFTLDKSILEPAHMLEVNHIFNKLVYENISFLNEDDYGSPYLYRGDINAITSEKSIKITGLQVSNYMTIMKGFIMYDTFSEDIVLSGSIDECKLPTPSSIRNQFVVPRFATYHYWNGIDDKIAHELALIDNVQRIRLFVDDTEIPFHEETISIYPTILNDDGTYPIYMEFDGFSFEKAQKIEIHFGDEIVSVK